MFMTLPALPNAAAPPWTLNVTTAPVAAPVNAVPPPLCRSANWPAAVAWIAILSVDVKPITFEIVDLMLATLFRANGIVTQSRNNVVGTRTSCDIVSTWVTYNIVSTRRTSHILKSTNRVDHC